MKNAKCKVQNSTYDDNEWFKVNYEWTVMNYWLRLTLLFKRLPYQ